MDKQNNSVKVLTIVVVIAIVLVIAQAIFIIVNLDKLTGPEEKEVIVSNEEKDIEELNIKSSLVTQLYGYIPQYDVDIPQENAYQSYKTSVDSLQNAFLLANAFRRITISNEDKEVVEGNYDSGWFKFKPEILQAEVKKLYGKELPNESFSIDSSSSCLFEDGKYQYGYGGMSGMGSENVRKITKAYIMEDNLYIEDEYLYIENIGFGDETGTFIYETSDKSNLVAKYSFEEKLAGNTIVENLNNMKKYKHTFKKGQDGEYYWVSSEPIV